MEKLYFTKSITYTLSNTFCKGVIDYGQALLSGKLTSEGQMTIPVELRNLLKLNEGDRLAFILNEKEGIIEVQPKTKKSIRGVMGALKPAINLNADEAIDLAKTERAKELNIKRTMLSKCVANLSKKCIRSQ